MIITFEELARIRSAAIGDMLGDSKVLDELGPAATIFRLCRELERLEIAEKAALMWTDEPPKEVGKYWWRWTPFSEYRVYNVRLIPTIHGLITYDHSAYEAEHVEDIGGQWAGPIPEPREPK